MTLRRVLTTVVALVLLIVGAVLVPVSPADGAAAQHLLFDHTASHVKHAYWQPASAQPTNYVAPANYRDGRVLMRLEIKAKPSTKVLQGALCFWRHGTTRFQWETCAPSRRAAFSTAGVSYVDFGAPASWWKKNGVYDWTKQASIIRIMLKDPVTGKLMVTSNCGAACYPHGDIDQHVPISSRAEVIFVAKGAAFTPPTHWRAGCPAAWASTCQG